MEVSPTTSPPSVALASFPAGMTGSGAAEKMTGCAAEAMVIDTLGKLVVVSGCGWKQANGYEVFPLQSSFLRCSYVAFHLGSGFLELSSLAAGCP